MDTKVKFSNHEGVLKFEDKFLSVYYIPEQTTIACNVTADYIPKAKFVEAFGRIADIVKTEKVSKFIFDKTKLTTFDQASMTWYHLEWKPEMFKYGLKSYRKLLPTDKTFRMSVDIGKLRISKEYPDFNFDQYDIQYCESLEEAFEK